MSRATGDLYGLVVRFVVLDGHEAAFDQLTAEIIERIRAEEPGTLVYLAHAEAGLPAGRVFYELYRDRAAFEAHESAPHVWRFLLERGQHLRGDPQVWRVSPVLGLVRPDSGAFGG